MADEIIKLIEYITGNPVVQGAFIGYVIFSVIVVLVTIAIFTFVLRTIFKNRKRWK